MEEKKYLKITEDNDWEGEQWIHYVLVDGNEDVISRIVELVKKYGPDNGMKCAKERKLASEVDMKCAKRSSHKYMNTWGKNDRRLSLEMFANVVDDQTFSDIFYKGKIRDIGENENEESELLL